MQKERLAKSILNEKLFNVSVHMGLICLSRCTPLEEYSFVIFDANKRGLQTLSLFAAAGDQMSIEVVASHTNNTNSGEYHVCFLYCLTFVSLKSDIFNNCEGGFFSVQRLNIPIQEPRLL